MEAVRRTRAYARYAQATQALASAKAACPTTTVGFVSQLHFEVSWTCARNAFEERYAELLARARDVARTPQFKKLCADTPGATPIELFKLL